MNDEEESFEPEESNMTRVNNPVVGFPLPEGAEIDPRKRTVGMRRSGFVKGIAVRPAAHLEITAVSEDAEKVRYELGTDTVDFGRSSECEILIDNENVSRKHARISFINDEYHLEDLDSTNGTYVNGVRISRCTLRSNDLIEMGGARIFFMEERRRT